ncbi:hypothetical protein MFUL124B02_16710 [Myxococcus fulvus 124B02]|nr:hypothetical protein MFUL124B02_16710 [Myxococcus fulvus 124B02]
MGESMALMLGGFIDSPMRIRTSLVFEPTKKCNPNWMDYSFEAPSKLLKGGPSID